MLEPWSQLGVAGLLVGLSVWFCLILLKMLRSRDQTIEEKDAEIRQLLKEKDQEIRELSKAQMELAERALPSLNDTARVVREAVEELRRSRRS
jgi:cell division protein FtsB